MSYPGGMVYPMEAAPLALLPATEPFSLGASLRALSGFAPCAGDQTVTGERIRKALPLSDTEAAVVEIAPRPDSAPGIALRIFAARALSAGERAGVELAVRRWLSLDDELAPFLAIARRDPALRPILTATHGLHQVRFASLAEGAV
jgi:DNA-3-methyladenine glycosylase II